MSQEDYYKRAADFAKLEAVGKDIDEIKTSMQTFHNAFSTTAIQLATHFEADKARDEKIAHLIKVIEVDNGKPCLISRIALLEKYVAYVVGGSAVVGVLWTVMVVFFK